MTNPRPLTRGKFSGMEIVFRRCSALFVDLLVVFALYFFLYILISGLIFSDKMASVDESTPWRNTAIFTFLISIPVLYFSILESSALRGSIGKLILNLKVSKEEGSRMPFYIGFLRGIVKFISIFLFPLLIISFFTRKNKAVHDFCSGSVVTNRN